jgi:hypothetical protein
MRLIILMLNTPISQWRRRKDLENLVALTSAQLSLLPFILSLIFIRYKISFKMMLQPLILMRFLPSYPRS